PINILPHPLSLPLPHRRSRLPDYTTPLHQSGTAAFQNLWLFLKNTRTARSVMDCGCPSAALVLPVVFLFPARPQSPPSPRDPREERVGERRPFCSPFLNSMAVTPGRSTGARLSQPLHVRLRQSPMLLGPPLLVVRFGWDSRAPVPRPGPM